MLNANFMLNTLKKQPHITKNYIDTKDRPNKVLSWKSTILGK